MGTNDVLGSFNHLLQSPPVLGCAYSMSVCNISSYNDCYCSSVKVNKNLSCVVVHKLHSRVFSVSGIAVVGVLHEQEGAEHTFLGAPVFSTRVEEVPIRTV